MSQAAVLLWRMEGCPEKGVAQRRWHGRWTGRDAWRDCGYLEDLSARAVGVWEDRETGRFLAKLARVGRYGFRVVIRVRTARRMPYRAATETRDLEHRVGCLRTRPA